MRSVFEPFEGLNIAAVDWGLDAVREALGETYSPDIELTTHVENLDYIEIGASDGKRPDLLLRGMAEANVEIVGRLIDAWSRRDLEAVLEAMHPQCEVRGIEVRETLRGHDELAAGFRDWFDAFEEFTIEPEDFISDGDRVLVPMRQRARGKGSGLQVEQRFYQLFTLRDGMVFRFEEYSEEADARKALGR
jgi:ketosteroid isomerase-like protein